MAPETRSPVLAGEQDSMISESMAKQEEELEKAAAKRAAKADKQAKEISAQEETARAARLKFLIEKSKVYTSILSEKLMKQQEASRSRGEELDKKKGGTSKKGNYDIAKYVDADDLLKGSNGESAAKALNKASRTKLKSKDVGNSVSVEMSSNAKPSRSARQPELVTGGVLRDYQLAGLEWMVSLYENGLNGILADEMGLGKTLQTIAFLAFLRTKGVLGPFLIAAPLSTVANWVNEVRKFTPDIPVLLYHGTKAERADLRAKHLGKVDKNFPIVVTSYEIVMNDRKFLQKYAWKYIVVDEGHRLKNLNCRLIRELKAYTSANRLLLTGTPLQNNLSELWSLLNFLLPDIFSDLESFQSWFDFSSLESNEGVKLVDEDQQSSIVAQLHQILKPFLLRRLKVDVEKDLPKKREYLLYAPMTAEQSGLYKAILGKRVQAFYSKQNDTASVKTSVQNKKRKAEEESDNTVADERRSKRHRSTGSMRELTDAEWFDQVKSEDTDATAASTKEEKTKPKYATNQIKLQNMLMSLRKACNHPFQMDWPVHPGTDEYIVDKSIVNTSGKMLLLHRLLSGLFAHGHKVLIFSQFTQMLDIIEAWSEDILGLHVSRIDGTVDQETRRAQIAEFHVNPDHKLFLLSTRAGGLGINLTSADTVILFDSDWNPQSDLQAMDRVHRIGQKAPVIVYRLVSANTIESKILDAANTKRRLEKVVIQKDQFKSIVAAAAGDTTNQLNEILLSEDAESIEIKSENDEIISDADLAKIMDRSDAAYDTTTTPTATAATQSNDRPSVFKSVTTLRDAENDSLATH